VETTVYDLPTIEEATILAETRALRVRLGSIRQHLPMRLDRHGVAHLDRRALPLHPGTAGPEGADMGQDPREHADERPST
jgi:hypothetical protein